jgi:hypothetical protein
VFGSTIKLDLYSRVPTLPEHVLKYLYHRYSTEYPTNRNRNVEFGYRFGEILSQGRILTVPEFIEIDVRLRRG